MRFVTPEVVRIPLQNGEWIEVKKELTAGEEKSYRSAGMKGVKSEDGQNAIEIDWVAMSIARVTAYLVDWSATRQDGEGKTVAVPVTPANIKALAEEDFTEIDEAIQKHAAAQQDASKNRKAGGKTPTSRSR